MFILSSTDIQIITALLAKEEMWFPVHSWWQLEKSKRMQEWKQEQEKYISWGPEKQKEWEETYEKFKAEVSMDFESWYPQYTESWKSKNPESFEAYTNHLKSVYYKGTRFENPHAWKIWEKKPRLPRTEDELCLEKVEGKIKILLRQ